MVISQPGHGREAVKKEIIAYGFQSAQQIAQRKLDGRYNADIMPFSKYQKILEEDA